ncbi:extracellular calcium-sensing receptor-like [Sphaeramia orbicularis]|uniref:extracellular calcium-sensing receptor-like n=1 Tax=Sphaeramia orbicularis TaxID=375764 RepID=UPI0011807763|nr:extracellular calcium-sensing receptor-like [Sphaeramia orbicularis]
MKHFMRMGTLSVSAFAEVVGYPPGVLPPESDGAGFSPLETGQIELEGVQASVCSRWETHTNMGLFQGGDVVIGGLFNLYAMPLVTEQDFTEKPYYESCTSFRPDTLRYIHAMVFAVEEINRNNSLLQGVKLGYRILNSCGLYPWALQAALILVGGDAHSCSTNVSATQSANNEGTEEKTGGQTVPLLIGAASSSTAVVVSGVLAPLSISYIASCPCLSDRHKFPSFFRTVPNNDYLTQAMAQLAIRFKWAWVGVVIANNDYGHSALQTFQKETQGKGVCIDFVQIVNKHAIMNDAKKAAITIEASTARVILIFCWHTDVRQILLALAERNVTDRQFLASAAWSTSDELMQDFAVSELSSGVVGVAIRSSTIPGFENYLRSLNPYNHPDNVFIIELWEREFGCSPEATQSHKAPLSSHSSLFKSDYPSNNLTSFPGNKSLPESSLPPCTGTESLEKMQGVFTDMSQLRETYNVYLAVYAAAHALHSLLSCPNRDSPTNNSSTCSSAKHIKPRELLQHLNKVNISTPHGEMFYFQGADIPPRFDIVNWQKTLEGPPNLVVVGHVNEFGIHLNESVIQWNTGFSEVPVSVCSKSCPPGTRKANRKGEPVCCFDCIPCGEGEISNITGSLHCERCPPEFWSNTERTVCIRRQTDFLSFNETLGITLTTVAVSGVIVTTAVFVVFLYYRQTPMVRANNSELSFLLLLSLKLCFLCSLVFIGRPSVWSCRLQQAAFGISFVLCVSCLLVKTMVVLAAFRSARPGAAALMKWFGPGLQRGSVCLFTSVQIIICIIWLSLSPPVPHRDLGIQGSKVTLKCAMASVVGFSLVLGYIGLLACTCLLLAFLARKLPDNFNEAKLITFSMLIFCAVWVAFVPAYVSSPGKYVVAVEIFAILASGYGLLFCIFAPKCFIILLRPEKNSKKHLMGR